MKLLKVSELAGFVKKHPARGFGVIATVTSLVIFGLHPSFPTPDKLLVFLVFVFMMFGQGWQLFKHLFPFVLILLVYESLRGLAPSLNSHVHFTFMPAFDNKLFGGRLPTAKLQSWLWHGSVQWYDFVFYLAYMLHFVLPLGLAVVIWKYRNKAYWRFVFTYVFVSFSGFLTYVLFPAAPPWMAAQAGYIPSISRISSAVWARLGLMDFPSVYNKISPNPVAAVPSLHAAYATLFALFIYKFFGKKWGLAATIYPLLIYVGTVYQGEHYVFDVLLGIVYAAIAYLLTPKLIDFIKSLVTSKIKE